MALGELPGHPHGPIPHHLQQILQQGDQAMGGFEQHHGALFVPQGLQPLPAGAAARGQKSFEAEPARGQAAAHQGGGDGAGARHADHGNGLEPGGGHQLLAGVGNAGQARVAHHRHRLSSRQNLQKLGDAGGLIVLMEADQPPTDSREPAAADRCGGNPHRQCDPRPPAPGGPGGCNRPDCRSECPPDTECRGWVPGLGPMHTEPPPRTVGPELLHNAGPQHR
jgi:hypothetical protein